LYVGIEYFIAVFCAITLFIPLCRRTGESC